MNTDPKLLHKVSAGKNDYSQMDLYRTDSLPQILDSDKSGGLSSTEFCYAMKKLVRNTLLFH